ncbi:MAG: zinc ribbon domain-containing protein [Thermodesulfobacteriota bacterium]
MQPKKVNLDDQPRPCPRCGLPSARLKRLDHYLSLFFIPLIPVKRGEPFLECHRCGGIFSEGGQPTPPPFFWSEATKKCPRCRREVDPEFNFCPYCGQKIF